MDTHPMVHGCKIVNHHHSSGSTKQPTIIPIRAHPHHISQLIATDCADSLTTQIHHRSTKMAGNQIYTQPNQSRARNPPTELSFSSYTDQQREIDPWSPDKQTTRRSWTTTKKHPARTVRSKKKQKQKIPLTPRHREGGRGARGRDGKSGSDRHRLHRRSPRSNSSSSSSPWPQPRRRRGEGTASREVWMGKRREVGEKNIPRGGNLQPSVGRPVRSWPSDRCGARTCVFV